MQGVGYRYFVRSRALEHGVTGWVSNTPGGDVECEVQGKAEVIADFIQDLKAGPPLSRVDAVTETPIAEQAGEKFFEIKY